MSILKYKDLISERKLARCPASSCKEIEISAFRWIHNPIDFEIDFLPNHLYDRKVLSRKICISFRSEEDCSRCGISLYEEHNQAMSAYKNAPKKIKSKLGYTHLAKGFIDEKDGICSEVEPNGHFTFFEYEESKITEKFKLVNKLGHE